jgi:hypothetical protein
MSVAYNTITATCNTMTTAMEQPYHLPLYHLKCTDIAADAGIKGGFLGT